MRMQKEKLRWMESEPDSRWQRTKPDSATTKAGQQQHGGAQQRTPALRDVLQLEKQELSSTCDCHCELRCSLRAMPIVLP